MRTARLLTVMGGGEPGGCPGMCVSRGCVSKGGCDLGAVIKREWSGVIDGFVKF